MVHQHPLGLEPLSTQRGVTVPGPPASDGLQGGSGCVVLGGEQVARELWRFGQANLGRGGADLRPAMQGNDLLGPQGLPLPDWGQVLVGGPALSIPDLLVAILDHLALPPACKDGLAELGELGHALLRHSAIKAQVVHHFTPWPGGERSHPGQVGEEQAALGALLEGTIGPPIPGKGLDALGFDGRVGRAEEGKETRPPLCVPAHGCPPEVQQAEEQIHADFGHCIVLLD
eukprot:1688560-Lingulodinium_polyedra.AAC.1